MKHDNYIESEDYYDIAIVWIQSREFEKAIDCLKHTIELNPNFIYAYITLAEVFIQQSNYSLAIENLKRASKVDPSFDRIDYLLAKYAYKSGNYPRALKHIQQAIDKSPQRLYIKCRDVINRQINKP